MRKLEFNFDNEAVEKYILELQKAFPQYDINVNNANDFSLLIEEQKNCSGCNGLSFCKNKNQGFHTIYSNEEFSLKECKYKKEYRIQNNKESLIKTLYLPKKILDANIENFDINSDSRKKIYKHLNEFISNFSSENQKKGLYIYGSYSIGKTYTLGCIANELAKNNISCLLIYFPDLVVDLKNAMGTSRFESLLNMLKSIDVLMLDDLGSENMTPWLRDEILGPIFNYRLLENKVVFISSNLSTSDLLSHFAIDKLGTTKAERLISRLQALVTPINMDDGIKYKR